jgi:type III secretion protein Q
VTANLNGSQTRGDAVALPIVQPQDLHTINRLFQARQPLTLRLGTRALRLTPQWLDAEPNIADACTVTLKTDGGESELVLPKAVLNVVLADLDPALTFDALDGQQRAILIEYAIGGGLQVLEAGAGCKLAITDVVWGGAAGRTETGRTMMPFQLQLEGIGQYWSVLRMPSADAVRLVDFLDRATPRERGLLDVPVSLSVRWAAVAMTLGELHSLAPGDIILVDKACAHAGQAVAVIGEHLTAQVNVADDGFRTASQPRRVQGSGFEWTLDRLTHLGDIAERARLDETPVQVLFEYGRGNLTLSELARLGGGALLPLGAPADGLDIVVNGARIGRGEPTQIGSATGIRVTRLAAA